MSRFPFHLQIRHPDGEWYFTCRPLGNLENAKRKADFMAGREQSTVRVVEWVSLEEHKELYRALPNGSCVVEVAS